MTVRDRVQKLARRIQREFPERPYSTILQWLRAGTSEIDVRQRLVEERSEADIELKAVKQ